MLHLTKTNYERHFDWLTECCEKKMVNLRDVDKCKSGKDLASEQLNRNLFILPFFYPQNLIPNLQHQWRQCFLKTNSLFIDRVR